jgi:protein gp37
MTLTPARIPRSIARTMTGIEWTDFSANAWTVCTRIPASAGARSGCEICYAATFAQQRLGTGWGPGAPRRRFPGFVGRVRQLNALAARTGLPFAVFALSLGDWLDPEADPAWRAELVDVVESCDALTWLLLTHRPHLAGRLLPLSWRDRPPANVWPGVTIDHALHGWRWRQHAEYWAHTGRAWVSAEPLASSLASVDLRHAACIVIGGASGTMDPTWAFDDRWVLEAADAYGEDRIFFKQRGDFADGRRVGKRAAGRVIRGRLYDRTPWPRHRELLARAGQPSAATSTEASAA